MSSPPGKPGSRAPNSYIPPTHDSKRPATTPSDTGGVSPANETRHIPPPPDLVSEQPVSKSVSERTVFPHSSPSVVNEAAHTESLKNTFARQWKTVQVMRTQNHILDHLESILQSLNTPETPGDALPFIIIHIDDNGEMNRLVPTDNKAFQQQAGKAENARKQVLESMRAIDGHYNRERTNEFNQELNKAEATLMGLGAQLQAAGVTTPPVPKGFVPTSITEFLQTRVSNTVPERQPETPARPAPVSAPVKDNFHYRAKPVHEPETGEPVFGSSRTSAPSEPPAPPETPSTSGTVIPPYSHSTPEDDDEPLPPPPNFTNPAVTPESLAGQPPYLAEINKFQIFTSPEKTVDSIARCAPLALEAGNTDPLRKSADIRYRRAHASRKALLFELLMSQHRISAHDEAIHLNTDIIRLIQLGIMSTAVSEQDLLNRKPNPQAKEVCLNFLLQAENVTPPVAAFVADIVAGTQYQDSLAAKVMRDVIRLEEMRFADNFDIDSLESNSGYPIPAAHKRIASRFCDQWRKLLAKEGELNKAARLVNRAEDVPPPAAGYQPEDDANRRERLEEDLNVYKRHLELLSSDEELRFLKNLHIPERPSRSD